MSLPAAAFKLWATRAGIPTAAAPMARVIGINRTTLQAQLFRGRVHESVIVDAARAMQLDPVAALAEFDEFDDLQRGMRSPLPLEVLSQISLNDALVELMRRRSTAYGKALAAVHVWQDPPLQDGLRAWIDAVDPGSLRRELSERIGIAPPNLSAQITTNKLKPRYLIEAARIANTSLVSGLAAGGVITLREAGWPEGVRARAITHLRDVALNDLVTAKIAATQRGARRAEGDRDEARRIEETLG